ncbi:MAG: VOC family protein [Actinomycetota bacterium]|nr:VOC family protein [Actinomycetota bacterium]
MLSQYPVHTTIPVTDLVAAKAFYEGVLGYVPEMETPAGIIYSAGGGTRFLVYQSAEPSSGKHTVLGIHVSDIHAVVASLRSVGVTFQEYDLPGMKTENAVADTGPGYAAWFKDPEGNVIGLIQFKARETGSEE